GYAFGIDEILGHTGHDAAFEAAAFHGQRESALHVGAGAYAARADDALRGVVDEIGVRFVPHHMVDGEMAVARRDAVPVIGGDMVAALDAVAVLREANQRDHMVELAGPSAGFLAPAERMIGNVKLHDTLAQGIEPVALRMHRHALADRRRTGGGRTVAALDLDQADTAGTER